MKEAANPHIAANQKAPKHPGASRERAKQREHGTDSLAIMRVRRETVLEFARKHLNRYKNLAPKVMQGDDRGAIHDFRVASRRLQQMLDLLYSKPRSKRIRKLRSGIQRSRQLLSSTRNCDVLLQRVETSLARNRAGQQEVLTTLANYLENQRAENMQEALEKLHKLNLPEIVMRLQDCFHAASRPQLESPLHLPGAPPSAVPAAIETFDCRVVRELQTAWDSFNAQVAKAQDNRQSAMLHPVRIAAKRLRYLVEGIKELGVPGCKEVLMTLRRLQRHWGYWHDLEVMEQMMAEMLARPKFLRNHLLLAMRTERLMLRNQKIKRTYERRFFEETIGSADWDNLKLWVSGLLEAAPLTALKS
ncbi:MAG: CHAD domain-containing protein [Acidobacteria bacterium]|nr:CHAD domain-containing protein [Acidobacteriota bacterium]